MYKWLHMPSMHGAFFVPARSKKSYCSYRRTRENKKKEKRSESAFFLSLSTHQDSPCVKLMASLFLVKIKCHSRGPSQPRRSIQLTVPMHVLGCTYTSFRVSLDPSASRQRETERFVCLRRPHDLLQIELKFRVILGGLFKGLQTSDDRYEISRRKRRRTARHHLIFFFFLSSFSFLRFFGLS